ncbi:hypothetical protein Bca52824_026933 [Brassica carinata]|uniref:Uncharacterized protein n=1 Tax=Brassica carinata TaxID=52824 RepID=A0A8X7V8E0_BRACI|nr:hypothetical protein Bca52824_026933 [Brassica carinata]
MIAEDMTVIRFPTKAWKIMNVQKHEEDEDQASDLELPLCLQILNDGSKNKLQVSVGTLCVFLLFSLFSDGRSWESQFGDFLFDLVFVSSHLSCGQWSVSMLKLPLLQRLLRSEDCWCRRCLGIMAEEDSLRRTGLESWRKKAMGQALEERDKKKTT